MIWPPPRRSPEKIGGRGEETASFTALQAKITLAEQVALLGDPREFEQRLANDPKDHQARYDLAMVENARGNRDAAADHLLHIIRTDRDMERGRRAQTAAAIVRRLGPGGPRLAVGAAQALVGFVFLETY